ncbi:hypothetical protein THSYN_12655 [Candidatus Thiodictyon syntrophicum]|uniref:Uncharacterized protein n=1 Tax=Candidatus Thiodictyon syntrophicum TaxID=1166950 RepID=A0A2K8U853_9GAMM|nr:hypothetical protein THSYN_12655 [Candidatus Thiodictyon syntrophicum]
MGFAPTRLCDIAKPHWPLYPVGPFSRLFPCLFPELGDSAAGDRTGCVAGAAQCRPEPDRPVPGRGWGCHGGGSGNWDGLHRFLREVHYNYQDIGSR